MIATTENMKTCYAKDATCFAYSPTGEEYSANPGDYWNAPAGWTMKDENGDPMILVTRHTIIEEL